MDTLNTSELDDIPRISNDSTDTTVAFGGYLFIEQRVAGSSDSRKQKFLGLKAGYDKHTNAAIDATQKDASGVNSIKVYSDSWADSKSAILYYKMKNNDFSWYFGGGVTFYEVGWKNTQWIDYKDPSKNEKAPDISKTGTIPTLAVGIEYNIGKNFAVEAEGDINLGSSSLDNNLIVVKSGSNTTDIYRGLSWFNLKLAVKYYIF